MYPMNCSASFRNAWRTTARCATSTLSEIRADLQRLKRDSASAGVAQAAPVTGIAGNRKILIDCRRGRGNAFTVAAYFYLHRAPKLTDRDTIILGRVQNTTGDPVFDVTLRQGLASQLAQSPFLSLASEERIQQTLQV